RWRTATARATPARMPALRPSPPRAGKTRPATRGTTATATATGTATPTARTSSAAGHPARAVGSAPAGLDECRAADLGRLGARDDVDEFDRLRHLVRGEATLRVRAHLVDRRRRRRVGRFDDRVHAPAPLLVLQPDHDDVG